MQRRRDDSAAVLVKGHERHSALQVTVLRQVIRAGVVIVALVAASVLDDVDLATDVVPGAVRELARKVRRRTAEAAAVRALGLLVELRVRRELRRVVGIDRLDRAALRGHRVDHHQELAGVLPLAHLVKVGEGMRLLVAHHGLHQLLAVVEEVHKHGAARDAACVGQPGGAVRGVGAARVLEHQLSGLEVGVPAAVAAAVAAAQQPAAVRVCSAAGRATRLAPRDIDRGAVEILTGKFRAEGRPAGCQTSARRRRELQPLRRRARARGGCDGVPWRSRRARAAPSSGKLRTTGEFR